MIVTVIFGAQAIALGTYKAIKAIYPDKRIKCFLVSELGANANMLAGVPVKEINAFVNDLTVEQKKNIEILIATPENVMNAIEQNLDEVELYFHKRIDSVSWGKLMGKAFSKKGDFKPLSCFRQGKSISDLKVFQAKHCRDKVLTADYRMPSYFMPIQVGAAVSEMDLGIERDDRGENISFKNNNYSELTALYWIWKNLIQSSTEDKYYGLAHYRRYLMLDEADLTRISENEIDVILPYPMPYEPNIEEHHNRYLSNEEWNAVLQALQELHPNELRDYKQILNQEYMYNYNVILAKSSVLDAYCEWLFGILFRVEEILDLDGKKVANRYIGYIGETLETLYFMSKKDSIKIAHTTCKFLV